MICKTYGIPIIRLYLLAHSIPKGLLYNAV